MQHDPVDIAAAQALHPNWQPGDHIIARLARNAAEHPRDVAMRERDRGIWQEYSWSDYLNAVIEFAAGLEGRGVKPGDVVLAIGDNRPNLYFGMLGVAALRAIPSPAYAEAPTDELAAQMEREAIRFAVADKRDARAVGRPPERAVAVAGKRELPHVGELRKHAFELGPQVQRPHHAVIAARGADTLRLASRGAQARLHHRAHRRLQALQPHAARPLEIVGDPVGVLVELTRQQHQRGRVHGRRQAHVGLRRQPQREVVLGVEVLGEEQAPRRRLERHLGGLVIGQLR